MTFLATALTLPDGEQSVMLAVPARKTGADGARETSERAISGFTEEGQFAALVDGAGQVAASTEGFGDLNIGEETLRALVDEVREESDRLVKRLISGAPRRLPAGIARLTDDPAMHFLVVVDDGEIAPAPEVPRVERLAPETETDRTAGGDGAEAGNTGDTAPVVAPESREQPATPADTRHEQWYFAGQDGGGAEQMSPPAANDAVLPAAPGASASPVRFIWRTDAETRFTTISGEFAKAVGSAAANVTGRRFRDVADAFALDPGGEIAGLLERRDTWSGRTVLWPLAGTGFKAPVDLAALPAYDRDRTFEGFRGFGIVRLGDAVADPHGVGISLVSGPDTPEDEAVPPEDAGGTATEEPDAEPDPFQGEIPALQVGSGEERRASDKVIRLAEHRTPARGSELSLSEQTAFREIGDRLRHESEQGEAGEPEAPTPDAVSGVNDDVVSGRAETGTAEEQADEGAIPASHVMPSAFAHAPVERVRPALDMAILAHLPVPLLIHAGDVLHYANRAFLDLTGYADLATLEDAGGLDAIFAGPYDDHTEGSQTWGRTLRLRRADEDEIPVEAHLQSVPWNGGKALLLALRHAEPSDADSEAPSVEDRDDREHLQARLAEMRTIIDTATDGVVIVDNDGRIRSISRPAEALFGFEAEHVTGKPFSSLFAIESQEAAQDYLAGLSDNGVASVLNDGREVIGREAQGRFIPLFMTMGRLSGESGFCAVVRDITQWKKAEEELTQARAQAERSSSQKTDFLARVSHEIRTPLNAIIGFSELMMDEKFGPIGSDRYRDYLRDINRSGNHVLDLVNDLLDISKIEAGEQEMHYEAVALNDTLAETVAMMQPQANRERVIIRSSFASRLPDVVADLKSVRQIALNLLSNATRYTPAGGQVIVSTAYEGTGAVIMRVRDTGVGMSATEIDQALKPFKQINSLKRKRGDGTGLGLPLTRAMVEANRARFSINSSPGEGTLVEVAFPPTRVLAE